MPSSFWEYVHISSGTFTELNSNRGCSNVAQVSQSHPKDTIEYQIRRIPLYTVPPPMPDGVSSFWEYTFRVDHKKTHRIAQKTELQIKAI